MQHRRRKAHRLELGDNILDELLELGVLVQYAIGDVGSSVASKMLQGVAVARPQITYFSVLDRARLPVVRKIRCVEQLLKLFTVLHRVMVAKIMAVVVVVVMKERGEELA